MSFSHLMGLTAQHTTLGKADLLLLQTHLLLVPLLCHNPPLSIATVVLETPSRVFSCCTSLLISTYHVSRPESTNSNSSHWIWLSCQGNLQTDVWKSLVYKTLHYQSLFGISYNPYAHQQFGQWKITQINLSFIHDMIMQTHTVYINEIQEVLMEKRGIYISITMIACTLCRLDFTCKGLPDVQLNKMSLWGQSIWIRLVLLYLT